jgi:hypothetical protein
MSGPPFFQTRMGQIFYEHTMPMIAKELERIATAMEKQTTPLEPITKETILKYASEDELFALFHTFKEYWNEAHSEALQFKPLDQDLGLVVAEMKKNYL